VAGWAASGPRPEVVVCSPYVRARQTRQPATDTARARAVRLLPANVEARLCDRLMGDLELLTTAMVARRFPTEAASRRDTGEFTYRPPGGQSFGDIAVRVDALLGDLHARHAGRRVFLVAHDAIVLMLRYVVERLTFDDLATTMQTDRWQTPRSPASTVPRDACDWCSTTPSSICATRHPA
jgi:broad specificity phosphatase PhoE